MLEYIVLRPPSPSRSMSETSLVKLRQYWRHPN